MLTHIYDVDGVLCNSEAFIAEAACQLFREQYGIDVGTEDFAPFIGSGEDRYLGGVAEKWGVALDLPRDKERVYEIYARLVPGRMEPVPGVLSFIRRVREQGGKQAVATSADPVKLRANFAALGLVPGDFNVCITGADVAYKKPAPDIFLKAAEACGAAPATCVVFEDAVNGIQAAKAAGMRCVGIASYFEPAVLREAGADEVWPHFERKEPWI